MANFLGQSGDALKFLDQNNQPILISPAHAPDIAAKVMPEMQALPVQAPAQAVPSIDTLKPEIMSEAEWQGLSPYSKISIQNPALADRLVSQGLLEPDPSLLQRAKTYITDKMQANAQKDQELLSKFTQQGPRLAGNMTADNLPESSSDALSLEKMPTSNLQFKGQSQQANQIPPQYKLPELGQFSAGFGMQLQGAKAIGEAQAKEAEARGEFFKNEQVRQQAEYNLARERENEIMTRVNEQTDKLNQMTDNLTKTASVDPNRLWNNASTDAKITAGIGMVLGSLGAAMTGGPNYAMQMINDAIQRDIQAQNVDIDNKKTQIGAQSNLVGQLRAQFGDVHTANIAAQKIATGIALNKLNVMIAGTQSEQAKANAQVMQGQFLQQKNQLDMQLAMMMRQQAIISGSGNSTDDQALQMRLRYEPDEKLKEKALAELPEYQKHKKSEENINEAMKIMYETRRGLSPEEINRFNAARTILLSNTSHLFEGKSESEFNEMQKGLVPGMTWNDKAYQQAMKLIQGKLESQGQFPVLKMMGIAKPKLSLFGPQSGMKK